MSAKILVEDAVRAAEPRPALDGPQSVKKNYAERLSRHLATVIATGMRGEFPGTTPLEDGSRQEVRARSARGFKKLDVGYSTPELGLGLGVSIKTMTHPDPKGRRFTKNYSRIDNEFRAEANDYHKRQPFAVLIAVLFLPWAAAEDARVARGVGEDTGVSSFGAAVRYFRGRGGRTSPTDDPERFERFFICLYDEHCKKEARFFDAEEAPPRARAPSGEETCSLQEFFLAISAAYAERNEPPFVFKD